MSTVNKTINIYAKKTLAERPKVEVKAESTVNKTLSVDYPKVVYQGDLTVEEFPVEVPKESIAVDVLPEDSIPGKADNTFIHVDLEGYGEFSTTGDFGTADPRLFKYLEDNPDIRDKLYLHAGKLLSDIVSKADSKTVSVLKSLESPTSTSEEFKLQVDFLRNFVDAPLVQEEIFKGFFKRLEDNNAISDYVKLSFIKSINNSISAAEALKYDFSKVLTDIVDATDDFLGVLNTDDDQVAAVDKLIKEYASTSEFFSAVMHFYRYPEDSVISEDTVKAAIDKVLHSILSLSERLALSLDKVLNEAFVTSEHVSSNVNKVDSDLYSVAEYYRFDVELLKEDLARTAVNLVFSSFKTLLDNAFVSDSISFQVNFNRLFESSLISSDYSERLIDKVVRNLTTTSEALRYDIDKVLKDTLNTPEKLLFDTQKVLEDLVDATDDFYGILNTDDDQVMLLNKDLKDIVSNEDFVGKVIDLVLKDLIQTTEEFSYKTAGLEQTPEDTNYLQERVYNAIIKVLSEDFTSSDRVYLNLTKPFIEVLETSEDLLSIDVALNKIDSVNTPERLTLNFSKEYSEVSLIADAVLLSLHKRFYDILNSQQETQVFLINKLLFETIDLSEELYTDIIKPRFDTVTISDSGFINVQDYFAEFYVEPGYVGTDYNF